MENEPETTEAPQDVTCPWCGEGEFDLPGLKSHLTRGGCEKFDDCECPRSLFDLIFATPEKSS